MALCCSTVASHQGYPVVASCVVHRAPRQKEAVTTEEAVLASSFPRRDKLESPLISLWLCTVNLQFVLPSCVRLINVGVTCAHRVTCTQRHC